MRLVFPNGEHEQVDLEPGVSVIGSGEEADVRLQVQGVAEVHARISLGDEGASIAVDNAANITRVNGSLVVARTPVSGGDALLFNTVQCQVVMAGAHQAGPRAGAPAAEPEAAQTRVRSALPKFVLRGVSGGTFGKHFPLFGTTVIGRQADCDVCLQSDEVSRRHASITETPDGLVIEDLGSANGTFVNDRRVRRERLEPGDEIRFDTIRFLIQAPGQEVSQRRPQAAEPAKAADLAPAAGGGRGKLIAITVLVLVAAAVGLKLAGVL